MLRPLYNRLIALAERKAAVPWMAAVSFAESSFFPIPPDVMLIPMVLARRDKAWYFAAVCTIASVLGGFLGYAIGYFLLETVGDWLIQVYGLANNYAEYKEGFAKWGILIILGKGLTPIPYKIVAIAAGAAKYDLMLFFVLSIVARAMRFFLVAGLLRAYGAPIRVFIEKNLPWVATGFVAVVVSGFVALRFL